MYNEAKELGGKGNNEAYNLYNRAFRMFLTIAIHGNADAQFYVAYCYSNGLGIDKNDAQAVEWYRRSSEQGNAASQNNLGVCYGAGEGVSQDKKIAAEWFKRAAEQGDDCAQCNLADYYKNIQIMNKNVLSDHFFSPYQRQKLNEQARLFGREIICCKQFDDNK